MPQSSKTIESSSPQWGGLFSKASTIWFKFSSYDREIEYCFERETEPAAGFSFESIISRAKNAKSAILFDISKEEGLQSIEITDTDVFDDLMGQGMHFHKARINIGFYA